MQRTNYIASLTLAFIIITISLPSQAFFNSDVKKAKEFIAAGMYPQANELLNKRINEKPTDAEAHYLLGSCYIHQGNIRQGEERFDSAVRLDSDFRPKIGNEYKKIAEKALNRGDLRYANIYFSKTIDHNPRLKSAASLACMDFGVNYLDKNRPNLANKLFAMAKSYDLTKSAEIDSILNQRKKETLKKNLEIAKTKKIKIGLTPETYSINERKMDEWVPLFEAAESVNASVTELKSNGSLEKYDILYWDACKGKYRDMFTRQIESLIAKGKFLIYGGATGCIMGPKCKFVKGKGFVNCITAAEKAN